ncbi:type II/IV secretion system protein [Candidatus Wolfebacteria bacterium]|nr:type II/IV secretion system protein [Candidatus Wolfebacteria bacterium]
MKTNDEDIKTILLKENYISEEDIKKAEEYSKTHNDSFVEFLFKEKIITMDLLGQAFAESFGIPYSDLNSNQPTREQVLEIPEGPAHTFRIVIFNKDEKRIIISTDDPKNKELPGALKKLFPLLKTVITYSLSEDIDASFTHYQKSLKTRFSEIIKKGERIVPEILEEIINDALTHRASDIHFEPQESSEAIVRFRIDGVLHNAGRIPREYYENLINRIKVKSHLRIDEHFKAQDGSMSHTYKGKVIDLRTSIAPTINGEKIVLRLLASYVRGLTLESLGLSNDNQRILEASSKKPFGMILITGPTGSGKTTTLYALLRILNRPEVNITTIEDPVEYKIAGVNQIQVNPETDLTFSRGLRSIIRQDPDIILVGEIRDNETAEIATNAALTGHLVLSTFHANDAATSIPRLLDMGIEPFLLASTLEIVIAQRLIRQICQECRYSVKVSSSELAKSFKEVSDYFPEKEIILYKGRGCESCGGTAFKGRTAIFEFIQITEDIKNLILKNPSTNQIWEIAKKQNSRRLFEDGIDKVKNGITTLDELLRVASPSRNV